METILKSLFQFGKSKPTSTTDASILAMPLIMDIGMNNGRDSLFYLQKGFRVVAVEANPILAQRGRGSIGEYPAGNASATSMTSVTPTQCAGVSLTAGDWDVWGNIQFSPAGSTTVSEVLSGINVGSVALPSAQNYQLFQGSLTTGGQQVIAAPMQRVSLSASTNVYLIGYASFGTSTMQCNGWIQARRVR